MNRVFSFSSPYPNNRNGVYFPPPINSPYKTARCLFIRSKLVNEKLHPLKPPGLSASKWNSLNLEVHGKKKISKYQCSNPKGAACTQMRIWACTNTEFAAWHQARRRKSKLASKIALWEVKEPCPQVSPRSCVSSPNSKSCRCLRPQPKMNTD